MEVTYSQMVMELLNQAVCSGDKKANNEEKNIWYSELRELNKRDRIVEEIQIDTYMKVVTIDPLANIDLDNNNPSFMVNDDLAKKTIWKKNTFIQLFQDL